MNEAQVSLDDTTYPLPRPFMVIATQNPREYDGTYPAARVAARPLPPAHPHRLPGAADERALLRDAASPTRRRSMPVLDAADVVALQEARRAGPRRRLASLDYVLRGGRPRRAGRRCSRSASRPARLAGAGCGPPARARWRTARDYLVPDDVKQLAVPALAHRVSSQALASRAPRPGARCDGEARRHRPSSQRVPVPSVRRARTLSLGAALRRLFPAAPDLKPHPRGEVLLVSRSAWASAAINTGNNLLYLLVSALLALIVVSGILSERHAGPRPDGIVPDELYAGQPALARGHVANRKRRLASYSVTVELLAPGRARWRPRRVSSTCRGSRRAPSASSTWEKTLRARAPPAHRRAHRPRVSLRALRQGGAARS